MTEVGSASARDRGRRPVRLRTTAYLGHGDPTGMSVHLRLEVERDDGSRVVLLEDRGWGGTGGGAHTTVTDVQETARTCVGPDEPWGGSSAEEEAVAHWARLAGTARAAGTDVTGTGLASLPHDVVLSPGLRGRLADG